MWFMEYEVLKNGEGKIIEKKSTFIGAVASVHSEQEALDFIATKKKEHYDARHNCFAYLVGDHNELMRSSDDGEPSGTAGRPMLDVLLGANVHNICVVVTRYFGGVLLGTGGLVRAYSKATEEGLKACTLLERHTGVHISLDVDYGLLGKVQYLLNERNIFVADSTYSDRVVFDVYVDDADAEPLKKELINQTNAQIKLEEIESCAYGIADGELIRF